MKFFESSILVLLLFAVSIVTIGSNPNHALAEGSLDGKSFSINYKDKGEVKKDEITFVDGEFFSINCEQHGFGPAPYETTQRDTTTIFKSTLESEEEGKGKVKWSAIIEGDHMLGKFIWSKEGHKAVVYKFDGSLIKKEEN